jgi:hypothetical protein
MKYAESSPVHDTEFHSPFFLTGVQCARTEYQDVPQVPRNQPPPRAHSRPIMFLSITC